MTCPSGAQYDSASSLLTARQQGRVAMARVVERGAQASCSHSRLYRLKSLGARNLAEKRAPSLESGHSNVAQRLVCRPGSISAASSFVQVRSLLSCPRVYAAADWIARQTRAGETSLWRLKAPFRPCSAWPSSTGGEPHSAELDLGRFCFVSFPL